MSRRLLSASVVCLALLILGVIFYPRLISTPNQLISSSLNWSGRGEGVYISFHDGQFQMRYDSFSAKPCVFGTYNSDARNLMVRITEQLCDQERPKLQEMVEFLNQPLTYHLKDCSDSLKRFYLTLTAQDGQSRDFDTGAVDKNESTCF